MSLVREDGSVQIHAALLNPRRHQISGVDRTRGLVYTGAFMVGEFMCFFGAFITVDWALWVSVALLLVVAYVATILFLRRIGKNGGYFQGQYDRRIREQEVYPRSGPPNSRPRDFPQQQRI